MTSLRWLWQMLSTWVQNAIRWATRRENRTVWKLRKAEPLGLQVEGSDNSFMESNKDQETPSDPQKVLWAFWKMLITSAKEVVLSVVCCLFVSRIMWKNGFLWNLMVGWCKGHGGTHSRNNAWSLVSEIFRRLCSLRWKHFQQQKRMS